MKEEAVGDRTERGLLLIREDGEEKRLPTNIPQSCQTCFQHQRVNEQEPCTLCKFDPDAAMLLFLFVFLDQSCQYLIIVPQRIN